MTLDFCPALDEIYRTRRAIGQSGRVFEGLTALSTPNNLLTLRALMMERRPARTLEVGLSFGGSALAIAASHRDLGHAPARQHVAIDPFQLEVWDDCGIAALSAAGLGEYTDVRRQLSSDALPALLAAPRAFDLIYIDGSHIFEDVFVDAYFSIRLLSRDGIVLFDDSGDAHVAKVLKFLRTNWAPIVSEVDLASYRTDGGSLRYRIARQLGRTQLCAFRLIAPPPRAWDSAFHDF